MMASSNSSLHGTLRENEPMSRHTSWHVGGTADRFYQPAGVDDLAAFLAQLADDEPLMWLGLGSNLLVRDGGIRGTVICTSGVINELIQIDKKTIRAGAGVACAKVAKFSARCGLTGAEFMAGIPGTVGGALRMNAGAFGGETWPLVAKVETINLAGKRQIRMPDEYKVEYRRVVSPEKEWFIAADFKLMSGNSEESALKIKALLSKRSDTQPIGQFSSGSVFRNPPNDYAARLIDACDLKGLRVGGAHISMKHANFIVTDADATAADVEVLIVQIQLRVLDQYGIQLEPEVHIVGEVLDDLRTDKKNNGSTKDTT